MDRIIVTGNGPLSGEIEISGAKNACLTLMPAALLSEGPLTLTNVPNLSDIATMRALLGAHGVEIAALSGGHILAMSTPEITNTTAHYDIVRKMRASILVLGPLLARMGEAIVSLPGGCAIGTRPVDLHLRAMEALGAVYELKDGYVYASAPNGLRGGIMEFPVVSVGATENMLLAATLAKGVSEIRNAACEPEIVDLAQCLRAMGARISGEGTPVIRIEGVERLGAATHRVIADRIELGTYMLAPAIAGGDVFFPHTNPDLLMAFIEKLQEAGVQVIHENGGLRVRRDLAEPVRPVDVTTAPFPGFPTDLQAQMMALLCMADGVSHLEETIFENRFMHAPELMRMGAQIRIDGNSATLTGVPQMIGAPVMATDLRASVSLILAGLRAKGETIVSRVYHLDRGYERLEEKLSAVGALIRREKADE